jgi:alkylhydroperoxidase/carboxymuconolactone decarboxylase family protein YurZ
MLSASDRELILVGLYAVHGRDAEVAEHGRLALAAGARPEALEEVVLTAAISRGPRAIATAHAFLSTLPRDQVRRWPPDRSGDALVYFKAQFGSVPEWARKLAQCSPASFESYATLRATLLADGAASRATKELLTMCLNVLDNTPGGVKSHAAAALRSGADREAVLEALLLAVRVGGIVAWIDGVEALSSLFATLDAAHTARGEPAV